MQRYYAVKQTYRFRAVTNLLVFLHSPCPREASFETAFLHGSTFVQLIPHTEGVTGCHEMEGGRNTSGATFPSRHAFKTVTGAQFLPGVGLTEISAGSKPRDLLGA